MSSQKTSVTQSQLAKARQFIENKQYADARKLLKKIDDPTAERWLKQLDARFPAKKHHTARNLLIVALAGTVITLVVVFALDSAIKTPQIEANIKALDLHYDLVGYCSYVKIFVYSQGDTVSSEDRVNECDQWATEASQRAQVIDVATYCRELAEQEHRDRTFDECMADRDIIVPF